MGGLAPIACLNGLSRNTINVGRPGAGNNRAQARPFSPAIPLEIQNGGEGSKLAAWGRALPVASFGDEGQE